MYRNVERTKTVSIIQTVAREKNRPKILEIEYFGLFFSYISQRKMFSVFDKFLGNLKSYAINTSFSFKQYSGNRGETI